MTALVFVWIGSVCLFKPLADNKKHAGDVIWFSFLATGAATIWDTIFLASQFQ